MIYASSSVVINSSANVLWNILEEFIKEPNQGLYVSNCLVKEQYNDGCLRSISMSGESNIIEKVLLIKDQYKIVISIENHPLYIGDTIYQIISSGHDQMADKRVTLCAVLNWRIRPGIIEAPSIMSKQIIMDDLLGTISEIAAKKW